jgi:hypothetical protein
MPRRSAGSTFARLRDRHFWVGDPLIRIASIRAGCWEHNSRRRRSLVPAIVAGDQRQNRTFIACEVCEGQGADRLPLSRSRGAFGIQ